MSSKKQPYHVECYDKMLRDAFALGKITAQEKKDMIKRARARAILFRERTDDLYELGRSISYAN